MPDTGAAELAALLSRLHDPDTAVGTDGTTPSVAEAMALYVLATRIVELQLQLAERGDGADLRREMATTRELLEQTRGVLSSALGEEPAGASEPAAAAGARG
jgi:hypothetical protein